MTLTAEDLVVLRRLMRDDLDIVSQSVSDRESDTERPYSIEKSMKNLEKLFAYTYVILDSGVEIIDNRIIRQEQHMDKIDKTLGLYDTKLMVLEYAAKLR